MPQEMAQACNFIFLNPVLESMSGHQYPELVKKLADCGYRVVTIEGEAQRILDLYQNYLKQTTRRPILDSRCPRVTRVIGQEFPDLLEHLAPYEPILVFCALSIYDKYVKPNPGANKLTIITPCSDLVENAHRLTLAREGLRFVTWKQFSRETGLASFPPVAGSPIPLGFFAPVGVNVESASGELEVRRLLQDVINGKPAADSDLLELLYCHNGCHNGDGV